MILGKAFELFKLIWISIVQTAKVKLPKMNVQNWISNSTTHLQFILHFPKFLLQNFLFSFLNVWHRILGQHLRKSHSSQYWKARGWKSKRLFASVSKECLTHLAHWQEKLKTFNEQKGVPHIFSHFRFSSYKCHDKWKTSGRTCFVLNTIIAVVFWF